ncbi:MAG TPA: type III pantothenate kinase [Thermoguttaceae bacterium]|nr:type III pantothenate kinase [Thermoguttaceae bacterium]
MKDELGTMSEMTHSSVFPLVAADVGNNRIKLGLFEADSRDELPEPKAWFGVSDREPDLDRIGRWLSEDVPASVSWWIGSVNRPTTTRLIDWLRTTRPSDRITMLAAGDLSLVVAVERPDMVGIDRLLDAVAVNRLRDPCRAAVIVDLGSAITVDAVSREGSFLGGVIMPGIGMSARALHEFTDLLPWIDVAGLTRPPLPLGKATIPAMQSGLFWGTVGAIRQLVELLSKEVADEPEVFLSGGAAPAIAEALDLPLRHVPHLTLAGIALTAKAQPEA